MSSGTSSMPIEEPAWWYGAPGAAAARLLQPAGWLAGRIAERRWRRARPYRAEIAVVCVGNFTAGGTGKTPTALAIAALLADLGERPVFLSRGYGGSRRGPHRVDIDRDLATDVGDEPLLLARAAPAFIARDRAAGARAITAEIAAGRLAASVIIMDDGLQNPSLCKDLAIAIVDGRRGFGNGRVIPAGPLRAPLATQLTRTDAVIINDLPAGSPAGALEADLKRHFAGPVLHAAVQPRGPTAWLADRPLVAFAGIGNPQRFFALAERLGGHIVARLSYADHHPLTESDAARVLAAAQQHDATIVTTEKDLARLSGTSGDRALLRRVARALPIEIVLPAADEQRLRTLLRLACGRRPTDRRPDRGRSS